ncbi:Histidine kinase-, DNA gyrase B-, and HSP90-like ATPase family protein, partial [Prunus dulcis]
YNKGLRPQRSNPSKGDNRAYLRNLNTTKTKFKGNRMKESYEGSRLMSTRSGSAAELSRLLAGGAKQKNIYIHI